MTATRIRLAVAVLVVATIAVVGVFVRPATPRAPANAGGVAPILASAAVCPSLTGGPSLSTTDMTVATIAGSQSDVVTYTPLSHGHGGRRNLSVHPVGAVHQTTPYAAVDVEATGPGAAGTIVSQVSLTPVGFRRGLTDVACSAPGTDWWFVGADGRIQVTDLLLLANTTGALANVDVDLTSSKGVLTPPGTTGITVPPHSSVLRRIANFAPDVANIGVHVHANSGTVAAALLDEHARGITPVGVDWIPPTLAPTRTQLITGFVRHAAVDEVYLGNAGSLDATVSLRVMTPTKNFQPAGRQSVVVPAGHVVPVDLSEAVAGEAAALSISSDQPVVAEGLTLFRPVVGFSELAWLAAGQPVASRAGIAANSAPFGQDVTLIATAPQSAATVKISTLGGRAETVTIPAGRTETIDLKALLHSGPAGPGVVVIDPQGGGPLYLVRELYAAGAHGPLFTAEQPTVLPRPARLPAVVPDLRAATG